MPVRRVSFFHNHVRASKADGGATTCLVRCCLAATASRFGLENTPAVIAGMDAQVGFLHDKSDVIAPHLFTGAPTEAGIAGSNSLAHASGELIARQESFQRRRRLRSAFMIDQLVQIKVGPDIPSGRHGNRCVLEMLGKPEHLGAVTAGDESGE